MTDTVNVEQVDLLPCPLCRGETPPVSAADAKGKFVICTGCSTLGPTRRSAAEAIAAWNTRHTAPAASGELVRALRDGFHAGVRGQPSTPHAFMHRESLRRSYEMAYDEGRNLAALSTARTTADEIADDLGCEYCRNDGPLTDILGTPRCPRCDAEYPTDDPTPTTSGEVSQRARDAASQIARQLQPNGIWREITAGKRDEHRIVQAFARFEADTKAEVEVLREALGKMRAASDAIRDGLNHGR